MEKKYKPVPDVECLKYHGTPEKPDIKIFVSHRIDLDSETIDNPLYIPVRCGAVYDEREDIAMLGDDTGENISEKRESFCEYTVMYWAWKNIKADYYGLCHFRRYLSFLDEDISGPSIGLRQGIFDSMSEATLKRCGLTDKDDIRKKIIESDITVSYEYSLKDADPDPTIKTVKESWLKRHKCFLTNENFESMMQLIKKYAPKYYDSAEEFVAGNTFFGFNCFVMKRELFNEMCEFMFPIMFEFDANLNKNHFSTTQKRAVGYLGEWLFSIFIHHVKKRKMKTVKERQLIGFQNTEKTMPLTPIQEKKTVSIVFSATDTNRPMIGVQIQSILEHANSDNYYDFIILHRSYDADSWKTYLLKEEDSNIQMMVEKYPNASIRFYDPKEELDRLELRDFNKNNWEEATYIFAVPWILTNYEKVIFLQDGVLAQSDVAELLCVDLGDKCIGAVKNVFFGAALNGYIDGFKELCNKKLKILNPYDYVSTDVLLLNLEEIRKIQNKSDIFSTLESKLGKLNLTDYFNEIYENRIKSLPQKWNKVGCWGPDYFAMLEYFPEEDNLQRTKEQASLINIHGPNGTYLPIQSWEMQTFWKYARKTPFYEQWLIASFPNFGPAIYDLQLRFGIFDSRTGARKFIDKLLPPGTRRREFAKKIIPKGSLRWKFCKQIYYIFKPQYRPRKEK